MKKKSLIVIIFLALIVLGIGLFYAQRPILAAEGNFKWEVSYPFGGPKSELIPDYVEFIYRLAFFVGGALAVLMIILGGIEWTTAGVNPQAKNSAKDKLTKSIMGVLLLMASYVMLRTINPDLVVIKEPVLLPDIEAERGADAVQTIVGADQCEGDSDTNNEEAVGEKGNKPICGDYCHYYCAGIISSKDQFPTDYFQQKRSTLGLEHDLGYMVGLDPGSGKDVVWCGCYALPETIVEEKQAKIDELLKKYGKQDLKDLPGEADTEKQQIKDNFEFTFIETFGAKGQPCEFLPDELDQLKSDGIIGSFNKNALCGEFCNTECRSKHSGERVFGVIASSNAGGETDTTWCSCFKGPDSKNDKNPWKSWEGRGDVWHPDGQPCEGAGDGYPRCGNYCYNFCKDKGYKFGTVSGGDWGAGTDSVLCTCMK